MDLIKRIWQRLPFPLRTKVHRIIHIVNNSKILLAFVGPFRQIIGVRRINKLRSGIELLVLGESSKFANAYTTNYQVFAGRFLDATYTKGVTRKFKYIYADNVVEHLSLESCRAMFKSVFEILEPGGSVRLCTPDVGKLVELYLKRDEVFIESLQADMSPHHVRIDYPVDILRQAFSEFGHHKGFVFDQSSIRIELESAGYEAVTFHNVSQSNIPAFCNLEQRVGGTHVLTQLCVEAVKPRNCG